MRATVRIVRLRLHQLYQWWRWQGLRISLLPGPRSSTHATGTHTAGTHTTGAYATGTNTTRANTAGTNATSPSR